MGASGMKQFDEVGYFFLLLVPGMVLAAILDPPRANLSYALMLTPYLVFWCIRLYMRNRRKASKFTDTPVMSLQNPKATPAKYSNPRAKPMRNPTPEARPQSGTPRGRRAKFADFLAFVVGPALFVLGLLSYTHKYGRGIEYSSASLALISVGVGLVAFGLLRRQWRREELKQGSSENFRDK